MVFKSSDGVVVGHAIKVVNGETIADGSKCSTVLNSASDATDGASPDAKVAIEVGKLTISIALWDDVGAKENAKKPAEVHNISIKPTNE